MGLRRCFLLTGAASIEVGSHEKKHIKETLCSIKRMNFCSSKKSMLTYIYDMLDVDSEKRSFLELEVDSLSASAFGRKFIMAVSNGTSCGVRCGGSLASFRAANLHTYIHIYIW